MAESTNMSMIRSMLAGGKGRGSSEVMSHWKGRQRAGSQRGWSWGEGSFTFTTHRVLKHRGQGAQLLTFTICTAEAAKSQQYTNNPGHLQRVIGQGTVSGSSKTVNIRLEEQLTCWSVEWGTQYCLPHSQPVQHVERNK